MKNNNRLGALPVPFFMMIGFACVTFSQVSTASAQTAGPAATAGPGQTTWALNAVFAAAVVHANSRVVATWQENTRDAYSTLARDFALLDLSPMARR
jgi:hypothetical protein